MCELWLHLRCSHHCYCASLAPLLLFCQDTCRPSPFFTRMAGVLYHTTTSSLLEIPSQNPIEVPGMACLSSGCQNGPHAKHMHREFEVPSDMDLAMLGPPILNG